MTIAYLNGEFLPLEDACVSVLDRGFLFGDGVYEVIPAYGGRLFRLAQHLQRLQNSLDGIRIPNPMNNDEWERVLNRLLESNADAGDPNADQSVYLQVTRGVAQKRDHQFPEKTVPTVYAVSQAAPSVDPALAERGASVVTLPDNRWLRCNIKAITLLPNVLLRQQAVEAGAAEAILVRDGCVIEGSASNVFIVRDGRLLTPPKGAHLLPGITRDLLLELAAANNIAHEECDIPEQWLREADEVWVTSSVREILPITQVDDKPVGDGRPGPLWKKMRVIFQDYKNAVRRGEAA